MSGSRPAIPSRDTCAGRFFAGNDGLLSRTVSRRTFGVMTGTAAVAAASAYAIASTGVRSAGQAARASFGSVRVVRAGRRGRFAAGSQALRTPPGPGDFARLASMSAAAPAAAGSHGHSGDNPATAFGQPVNDTWGDVVVLEVEVANTGASPRLFSPGQLRLKLGADGPTVTPRDASRRPGAIPAGATEVVWVSYLAPSDAAEFSVEFTDPQQDEQLALGVPRVLDGGTAAAVARAL